MKRFLVAACSLVLALSWTNATLAQRKQPNQLPQVELSGTVDKVRRGFIQLTAETVRFPGNDNAKLSDDRKKKSYVVAVHPRNTAVEVSGTATAKVLAAGQYVKLSGKMDAENNVQGEIGRVDVVIPGKQFESGVTVKLPPPKFASNKPVAKIRDFDAAGRVFTARRGELTLLVDMGIRLTVKLAEDAEVRYTTADYSKAKKGDSVRVTGRLFHSGQAVAEQVSITLASEKSADKKKTTEKKQPAGKE